MSRANKLGEEVNKLFKQIETLENEFYLLGPKIEKTYNRLKFDRPPTKPILLKHQLDEYEKLHKRYSILTKELPKLNVELQDKIQAQLNAEAKNAEAKKLENSLRRDRRNTTLLQSIQKQLREMVVSMRNTQVLVERGKSKAAKKPSKPISPRTKTRINNAMTNAFTRFKSSTSKSKSKSKSQTSVFGKGGALRRRSRKVRKSRKN
jgi:signal recognition particle GTPase